MQGKFLQVIPGEMLRYTWNWQGSPENTEVHVVFSDHENGTCIDLVHDGFESVESENAHSSGWDAYILGLSKLLKSNLE